MFKATFLIGLIVGVVALLAAYGGGSGPATSGATSEQGEAFAAVKQSGQGQSGISPAAPAEVSSLPSFSFVDQTRRPFLRENLLGQPTLVHFFFSTCNGPCPGVTSALAPLLKEFPQLRLVSISIDPAHDTPEVLREYAARLAAPEDRWLFLNGPEQEVLSLAQDGFKFGIDSRSKIHSTAAVLFDRDGVAKGSFKPLEAASLTALRGIMNRPEMR